jgi:hypothetical protein
MKPALILTLLAMTLTPVLAQQTTAAPDLGVEPDFIFIQEITLWKTLQAHDTAAFHAMLLPDFIYVQKAIETREQIMKNLDTCTLTNFKFSNHQLRVISPDAVIIAYNAFSEITCDQTRLSGNYNATTTWVRRDGKWFAQIHTETPTRP